jgi:tRNA A37 methylthiotransferase MiaB
LGERKRAEFAERTLGTKLKVLLEERTEGRLTGYSRNYVRVMTDGPENLTNFEVEVEATLVQGSAVVGQITRIFDSPRAAAASGSPA